MLLALLLDGQLHPHVVAPADEEDDGGPELLQQAGMAPRLADCVPEGLLVAAGVNHNQKGFSQTRALQAKRNRKKSATEMVVG